MRHEIEIEDAIACAAGGFARRDESDAPGAERARLADARALIVRFLESVPDGVSVLELREAIEESTNAG
jgi:hypothetical protein